MLLAPFLCSEPLATLGFDAVFARFSIDARIEPNSTAPGSLEPFPPLDGERGARDRLIDKVKNTGQEGEAHCPSSWKIDAFLVITMKLH